MKLNKKTSIITSILLLFCILNCFGEYCTHSGNIWSDKGRKLNSILFIDLTNNNRKEITSIQTSVSSAVFIDRTKETPLIVKAGDIIRSTVNWTGKWMHAYLYIDINNNGEFLPEINSDGSIGYNSELRAYTYYNNKNSVGNTIYITSSNEAAEPDKLSDFSIPSTLSSGNYRARFKIDWNDIDPCGNASISENSGCILDFTITVSETEERKITVAADPLIGGEVLISEEKISTAFKSGNVKITAKPNNGYRFVNYQMAGNSDVLSTEATYNDNIVGAHTVIANFEKIKYPVMARVFTNNISQQNRYLRSVSTTGTNTPIVFETATKEELPYKEYNTIGVQEVEGAVIDKTEKKINIDYGKASFDITFKMWFEPINNYNAELAWCQQSIFIDWNNDGKFDGDNEIYTKSNNNFYTDSFASVNGYTRRIDIPENTPMGKYRMRVVYYEPENYEEEWQKTLFTTKNNIIRNGIAYDFDITIGNKQPVLSGNIKLSTAELPVWYLIKSAPAKGKTNDGWVVNKYLATNGIEAYVTTSTQRETPEPLFEDKYLWRFEGDKSGFRIINKTGCEIGGAESSNTPSISSISTGKGGEKFTLSERIEDYANYNSYYFIPNDVLLRLHINSVNGKLQYDNTNGTNNDINPQKDGRALFNIIAKEEFNWNATIYSYGAKYKEYKTEQIDSIKAAVDVLELHISDKTVNRIPLNEFDSITIRAAQLTKLPPTPTFSNIIDGEKLTAAREITISADDDANIYWGYNIEGEPDRLYRSAINTALLSSGKVALKAMAVKNGISSAVKTITYTQEALNYPDVPTITLSGTNNASPYTRGYVKITSTGNVSTTYQIDLGSWKEYNGDPINIKSLGNGTHTLIAKATDNSTGLSSTSKIELTYNGNDPTNYAKWLDCISDNVRISQLSLPGTHESCATGGTAWHKCQNTSITSQLNAGIRVLDIRIGNDMAIYHGTTSMGIYFSAVVSEIKTFLNNNPSEFVIMSIKDENWSGDQNSWTSQTNSIMDNSGKAYIPGSSYDYTVGELRGKFIIIRRYGYSQDRGINVTNWPDDWYTQSPSGTPPLMIQDAYNYGGELASAASGKKWGYVQNFMEYAKNDADNGVIYINFMTATGFSTPGDWANKMVPKLSDYLYYNPKGRYGIIMMDFVGTHSTLVTNIVLSNNYPYL